MNIIDLYNKNKTFFLKFKTAIFFSQTKLKFLVPGSIYTYTYKSPFYYIKVGCKGGFIYTNMLT